MLSKEELTTLQGLLTKHAGQLIQAGGRDREAQTFQMAGYWVGHDKESMRVVDTHPCGAVLPGGARCPGTVRRVGPGGLMPGPGGAFACDTCGPEEHRTKPGGPKAEVVDLQEPYQREDRFQLIALMAATVAGGLLAQRRDVLPILTSVAIDSVTVAENIIEYLGTVDRDKFKERAHGG